MAGGDGRLTLRRRLPTLPRSRWPAADVSQQKNPMSAYPTTPESLLPLVLAAMSGTPDARLRELMASLTRHLHQFVLENRITEAEFEGAVGFVVGIGQATSATKNEVILASDLFGVSTLVALLNNPGAAGQDADIALLGPFWRARAPLLPAGADIASPGTAGEPLLVSGRVLEPDGKPLAGASVDVWQASPLGLYENQDPDQPDMNLRGRFITDAEGAYHFRSVRPAGYPVPTDGPCGALLRAQRRQALRPAHLHFMVSQPGYRVLVTQVYPEGCEHLDDDPVFGVTAALVGRFESAAGALPGRLQRDFTLQPGDTVFPQPPIP